MGCTETEVIDADAFLAHAPSEGARREELGLDRTLGSPAMPGLAIAVRQRLTV